MEMATPEQTMTSEPAATTNWAPTAKVSAGILAASMTTLLLPFWKKLIGFELAASEAAALKNLDYLRDSVPGSRAKIDHQNE